MVAAAVATAVVAVATVAAVVATAVVAAGADVATAAAATGAVAKPGALSARLFQGEISGLAGKCFRKTTEVLRTVAPPLRSCPRSQMKLSHKFAKLGQPLT